MSSHPAPHSLRNAGRTLALITAIQLPSSASATCSNAAPPGLAGMRSASPKIPQKNLSSLADDFPRSGTIVLYIRKPGAEAGVLRQPETSKLFVSHIYAKAISKFFVFHSYTGSFGNPFISHTC
ncbi:MAG: hypothetical protein ACLGP3_07970 [Acidobacteriota bacterium]